MLPGGFNKKSRLRNKGKLRYSTKEYSNPFFADRNKKKFKNSAAYNLPLKFKLLLLVILLMFLSIGWLLLYSKFFSITAINISGKGKIPPIAIENIAWHQINNNLVILFPQKNIFFFNRKRLARTLESKYSFNFITIEKKIPHTLIIEYEEKKHSYIWSEDEKYYYLDEEGSIISEANLLEISQKEYPIISNLTDKRITDNKITADRTNLLFIKSLFYGFKEYKAVVNIDIENEAAEKQEMPLDELFKIKRFIIDNEINTVKISLEEGPEIYFNTQVDIDKQIKKLIIIRNEKIKDEFLSKTYIDLRVGDSVYYR